jgi:hypothetical protein
MSLKELATRLGMEEYPEEFEKIYEDLGGKADFFNKEEFDKYEEKYSILREYYTDVIEGAQALLTNKDLSIWTSLITRFLKGKTREEGNLAKFPKTDLECARMMTIFPLLAMIPETVRLYAEHNFSKEEISYQLRVFHISIGLTKVATGKPGFTAGYYNWSKNYTYCDIFDCKSFNFQFKKMMLDAKLIRNKESGEFSVIMTGGTFHRTGVVLGGFGCEDEEGSFVAEFSENDEEYVAHEAVGGYVCPEPTVFKKSEWECVIDKGDEVISLHIPRNVDFSDEAIDESLDMGIKIAKERFPEHKPKIIFCQSWLLDPQLAELLSESSKIVKFGNRFMRFPGGKRVEKTGFSFVFLGYVDGKYEDLPEDTSLRRRFKQFSIDGGAMAFVPGFMVDRLIEN